MRIRESDFYIDRPSALGWRGLSLLIPACASAVGFFAFSVLGFGFVELSTLPDSFRTTLVLVGAFSLAFGGEVGTLSNTVEIFRKHGKTAFWDWASLVVSVLSTLAGFLLAWSALLGADVNWTSWLRLYGPVCLGLLAALDSYGGFCEFGLFLSSYDARMQEWQTAFEQFKQAEFTRAMSSTEAKGRFPAPIEHAQAVKAEHDAASKQARIDKMLSIYGSDPDASASSVADQVGVSRTTVYSYLSELEQNEQIRRNGHGVEVLAHV